VSSGNRNKPKPTPTPTPAVIDGETDWTGTTSNDFNTGSNWTAVSGLAPPGTSDVAWLKSTPTNKTINLSSNSGAAGSIVGFYFNGTTASGYDITSSSMSIKFTLTATGTSIGTELSNTTAVAIGAENTSGTNTIDAPIVLGAAASGTQTIIQASGGTLVINGVISQQNSNISLNLSGGTITLSGTNSYTGATTINSGTIIASNPSAFGTSSLTTVGAATLEINNVNLSTGNPINLNNTATLLGVGTAQFSGASVRAASALRQIRVPTHSRLAARF
jgi:autotransporter-associated beta strand protein